MYNEARDDRTTRGSGMDDVTRQEIQALIDESRLAEARRRLQLLAMTDDDAMTMLERLNKVLRASSPPPINSPVPAHTISGVAVVNPNLAWLELCGFFGFLGLGYLITGRTREGLIRLIGYVLLFILGWAMTVAVAVLTNIVLGTCLVLVMVVAQLAVSVWSALGLQEELEAEVASTKR
jgi:hypothetical protein